MKTGKLVSEGYKFTEGPAVNAKGEVFFNDFNDSKTYKIGLDGKVSPFIANSKKGNGQAFGPDGRLYAVASGDQMVFAYDAAGKATVIADGIDGNDIVVAHNGNIYVTNPPGGNSNDPSKIFLIKPNGEKSVVDTGLKYSNGIALSPDQTLLYVADFRSHWVYSYVIQPDGSLGRETAVLLVAGSRQTPIRAMRTVCAWTAMAGSTLQRIWESRCAIRREGCSVS